MILIFVLVLIGIISWSGWRQFHQFQKEQNRLISLEIGFIADEISREIVNIKKDLKRFVTTEKAQIATLASQPKNKQLLRQLIQSQKEFLLYSRGFIISDWQGKILVTNQVTPINKRCLKNLKNRLIFRNKVAITELHSSAHINHFDAAIAWQYGNKAGIIQIQITPEVLAHYLSNNIKNVKMYVVNTDNEELLELTPSGSSYAVSNHIRIGNRINTEKNIKSEVQGTNWTLVGQIADKVFKVKKTDILIEIALISMGLLAFFVVILYLLKQQKLKTQQSKELIESIISNLPGLVYRCIRHEEGNYEYPFISGGSQDIFQYNSKELSQQEGLLFRATHIDDFKRVQESIEYSATSLSQLYLDYRIIAKGGIYKWVREIAMPHLNQQEKIVWDGVILDIDELKKAENQLKIQSSALRAAKEGISILNKDLKIEWTNPSFCDLKGGDEAALYGSELDFEEQKLGLIFKTKEFRESLQSNAHWEGEVSFQSFSGESRLAEISITPIYDEHHLVGNYVLIMRDINEKKSLEMQLVQAQKLEAVGQLAAGIAHEINTPTQFVSDNTQFLQGAFEDTFSAIDNIQELVAKYDNATLEKQWLIQQIQNELENADANFIREEVPNAIAQSLDGLKRVSNIVSAMKEFSHPGESHQENVNINELIQSTITIATNEWKYVSRVETNLDKSIPALSGDSQLLGQVILNLIVNAAHAIADVVKEKGGLGLIKISTNYDSEWVVIKIKDSGTGIPDEIKDKIFDPFFTTKEVGKGTGQGLAISYSAIVDKHHGEIEIESEVGKGTTFIIKLPLKQL